tara:strand:- start:150 stop:536 length:387 start_codon:yes stop_codon:yes gene_type:complete
MKLLMENWRKKLKEEFEITGADYEAGTVAVERAPVEIDREEYVTSKEEGEWVGVNTLRSALEGTEFSGKQIANPEVGQEVISFTESDTGEQALPLKQVESTIYFKLNDTYGGSYYTIEATPADTQELA